MVKYEKEGRFFRSTVYECVSGVGLTEGTVRGGLRQQHTGIIHSYRGEDNVWACMQMGG